MYIYIYIYILYNCITSIYTCIYSMHNVSMKTTYVPFIFSIVLGYHYKFISITPSTEYMYSTQILCDKLSLPTN